jgi:hypothetical protein
VIQARTMRSSWLHRAPRTRPGPSRDPPRHRGEPSYGAVGFSRLAQCGLTPIRGPEAVRSGSGGPGLDHRFSVHRHEGDLRRAANSRHEASSPHRPAWRTESILRPVIARRTRRRPGQPPREHALHTRRVSARNPMREAGGHAADHDDGKIPRPTARSSFSSKRSVEPAGDHGYPGRGAVPARGTEALE